MKRIPVKNLSILGLVLMGASAVTAAILPNRASLGVNQLDVTLTQSEDGAPVYTCILTEGVGANDCTLTADTTTTRTNQNDNSTVDGLQTTGNTTTI